MKNKEFSKKLLYRQIQTTSHYVYCVEQNPNKPTFCAHRKNTVKLPEVHLH